MIKCCVGFDAYAWLDLWCPCKNIKSLINKYILYIFIRIVLRKSEKKKSYAYVYSLFVFEPHVLTFSKLGNCKSNGCFQFGVWLVSQITKIKFLTYFPNQIMHRYVERGPSQPSTSKLLNHKFLQLPGDACLPLYSTINSLSRFSIASFSFIHIKQLIAQHIVANEGTSEASNPENSMVYIFLQT